MVLLQQLAKQFTRSLPPDRLPRPRLLMERQLGFGHPYRVHHVPAIVEIDVPKRAREFLRLIHGEDLPAHRGGSRPHRVQLWLYRGRYSRYGGCRRLKPQVVASRSGVSQRKFRSLSRRTRQVSPFHHLLLVTNCARTTRAKSLCG